MLKSVTITLAVALVFTLSGCSAGAKSRRTQRAYEKYVHKTSGARYKRPKPARGNDQKMPAQPMPSEPTETIQTGPAAMPSENSGGG